MSLFTAWESLKDRHPCSFEEFQKACVGAEVIDVFRDGQDVGAVLILGPEIHACIKPEGFRQWFSKRHFALIESVIQRNGYATTSVSEGNHTGDKFVRRLGFKRVPAVGVWKYRKE